MSDKSAREIAFVRQGTIFFLFGLPGTKRESVTTNNRTSL